MVGGRYQEIQRTNSRQPHKMMRVLLTCGNYQAAFTGGQRGLACVAKAPASYQDDDDEEEAEHKETMVTCWYSLEQLGIV